MSNPKSSEHEGNNPCALFLNVMGIVFTYTVILIFCIRQVTKQPDNPSADTWLEAIVDAVCVSTFTYILTQTINNLAINKTIKAFKINICMLFADIPYILLYGVFEPRSRKLNIFLCLYSIFLVILAFYSIHLTVKKQESGQASSHMIEVDETGQKDAVPPPEKRSPES